ncbi:vitellogenin-like [Euwallacea fornicatus]|uniref:vitellogenin-like n=1 Tax=Euwallacea fornicatus TaxID=995702 RepID=UPI00338DB096
MRSCLVLLVFVATALASYHPGWKDNTEYVYTFKGRTLTALHEISNQYSGIFLKAKLHISSWSDTQLQAWLSDVQYAQIHTEMPDDWDSQLHESRLNYKPLEVLNKHFNILTSNGMIKGLVVEKEMTTWEANLIKSILSQLQLDLFGENVVESPMNDLPTRDNLEGSFKTMEETITGEIETSYEIHRLPEYLMLSQPWLAPQQQLQRDGQTYELIKTKNFTHNHELPMFHFGLGQVLDSADSNQIGDFFIRHCTSRMILSGKLSKFTIQSSNTVNKIMIKPTLSSHKMGMVISNLNLALSEIKNINHQLRELTEPVEIGNLIYSYESPFAKSNEVRQEQEFLNWEKESHETNDENSWQRLRRSAERLIRKGQSGSKSSEEIQHQSEPNMENAPEFPLLPYFIGYKGQSVSKNPNFDLKENVLRIANEISEDVSEPETILKQSTLSKYTILSSLIRLMNLQEIRELTHIVCKSNMHHKVRLACSAFRDAVAQAGTGPAFLTIEEWISSRKIEGEEAAELISVMANAARIPTDEYMNKFFELTQRSEVKDQEYLNDTAILCFTNLIHKVYINKNESHNQYPVHSFKHFATEEGSHWAKTMVIKHFGQHLDHAVTEGDSRKIHIYIRALGNIGHKKILEIFEPYLEGKKQCSQFQRLLMVLFMDKLVVSFPEVARTVMYRIYQNVGEVPEVRVIAVYQLMRTNPPTEMLQRMAQNTNTDPQEEVNAVVKSCIETACKMSGSEYETLSKAAESARPLLTKKDFSKLNSANLLEQTIMENMNIIFKRNLLYLGSDDHMLPKGGKYTLRGKVGGFKHYFINVQTMISSVKELVNVLRMQTEEYHEEKHQRQNKADGHKWSSEKIAETLQLPVRQKEQLEGFIYAEMLSMYNMWSFDNQSIQQIPQALRKIEQELKNGKEIRYMKLRQMKEIVVSLPTEMGLPFVYSLDIPLLIQVNGRIHVQAHPEVSDGRRINTPNEVSVQVEGCVTMSGKAQIHLSIVCPFNHQLYTAGVEKNVQIHVPMDVNVKVDVSKASMSMEWNMAEEHKNARLFHYSTWPYTSRSDIMKMDPMALQPNTQHIKVKNSKDSSFDYVFGQNDMGIKFRAWGHYPHKSINLWNLVSWFKSDGVLGVMQNLIDDAALQHRELSLAVIPKESTCRKVVLHLSTKDKYNKKSHTEKLEKFLDLEKLSSKIQYDHHRRQEDLLQHVSAGINNAFSRSFDVEMEFLGEKNMKYSLTMALSTSYVSPKSHFIAYVRSTAQRTTDLALQVKSEIPNISELNFIHALSTKPKAVYEIMLQQRFNDEEAKIIKGVVQMTRNEARQNIFMDLPMYHKCKEEMQEKNYQLSACQNMTLEANYLNDINMNLQYENVPSRHIEFLHTMLQHLRVAYYPMSEVNHVQSRNDNEIELRAEFSPYDLQEVDVTIELNEERTKFLNISLNQLARTILVSHPMANLKDRMVAQFINQDNKKSSCVIGQTAIHTFNHRTYPASLENDWTLVMQYIPKLAKVSEKYDYQASQQLHNQIENFVILAREVTHHHKEIKMTFNTPKTQGKTIEMSMQVVNTEYSPELNIFIDGERVHFDENNAADLFNGFIEMHLLPNGEVKCNVHGWFHVVFDGVSVKITPTTEKLYDATIGLCGVFNKDKFEDFWTPNDCIAKSAQDFVQSYKLEGRTHSPLSDQKCVRKILPMYTNVVSKQDVTKRQNQNWQSETSNKMKLRSRYVELNGDICFSVTPQLECKTQARRTVSKDIPVHCINKSKTAYFFKNQIDQGGYPDFSDKAVSKTVSMEIHQECY